MSGELIMSLLLGGLIVATGIFFHVVMKKEFANYTNIRK